MHIVFDPSKANQYVVRALNCCPISRTTATAVRSHLGVPYSSWPLVEDVLRRVGVIRAAEAPVPGPALPKVRRDVERYCRRVVTELDLAPDRAFTAAELRSICKMGGSLWKQVREALLSEGLLAQRGTRFCAPPVESTSPQGSRVLLRLADVPLSATRLPQPGEVAGARRG